MSERRRFPRRPIWKPVNVNTMERRDRVGMIRDMSETGVLFHSRSRFAIGERVSIEFRPDANTIGSAAGQVVRAFRDTNEDTLFPYVTAIQLEHPTNLPRDAG
jgi:hypothetical protein